jgi:PAS domain S-box-containing protein
VKEGAIDRAMNEIERVVNALDDEEDQLLQKRMDEAGGRAGFAVAGLLLGSGIEFALFLLLFFLLRKQVKERQYVADHLRRSEEVLKAIINGLEEGITLTNSEGRFEFYNAKMKEFTGYSVEEANRNSMLVGLLAPFRETLELGRNGPRGTKDSRSPWSGDIGIVTKTGVKRLLRVSSTAVRLGKRNMFLSTYRDVTPAMDLLEEIARGEGSPPR